MTLWIISPWCDEKRKALKEDFFTLLCDCDLPKVKVILPTSTILKGMVEMSCFQKRSILLMSALFSRSSVYPQPNLTLKPWDATDHLQGVRTKKHSGKERGSKSCLGFVNRNLLDLKFARIKCDAVGVHVTAMWKPHIMKLQISELVQRAFRWVPSRSLPLKWIILIAILGVGLLMAVTLLPRVSNIPYVLPSMMEKLPIPHVDSLIQAIRNSTRDALQGRAESTFTETERERWHQKYPCRSRERMEPLYSLRKIAQDLEPNSRWTTVFSEYEKLHRACIQSVGDDLSGYFLAKSNSSGCKFYVSGIARGAGLGNKLLSAVSGLLYSILTQRVYLVPAETLITNITCEPFEGSSWVVDPDKIFTPDYKEGKEKYWSKSATFYAEVDEARNGKNSSGTTSSIYSLTPNDFLCHPGPRFFCDTEQAYLSQVPWLYVDGCLYFLPKLFAIPTFRPFLEELFPDRMALTHLLRSSILPSDDVWRRVEQIHSVYMKNSDRVVGVQVRYRDGKEEFNKVHDLLSQRVYKCAIDNNILPGNGTDMPRSSMSRSHSSWSGPTGAPTPTIVNSVTTVFITSLYSTLHDFLSEILVRNPPFGEDIGIVQVTHGKDQHYDVEEDKQALTEILSLSFSDYLFVTPLSTFGGLAQAYGALKPWFIDNRPESKEACTRAQTIDVCYQIPEFKFSCPYEPHLNGRWVLDTVPYLKDCLKVDAQHGIQLNTASR